VREPFRQQEIRQSLEGRTADISEKCLEDGQKYAKHTSFYCGEQTPHANIPRFTMCIAAWALNLGFDLLKQRLGFFQPQQLTRLLA